MSPADAVAELNPLLAHLWMVRTFLKHAEEVQDDAEMLEVPRMLYDSIRAVEPAYLRGDYVAYIRRLKGKLPKLRRVSAFFAAEHKRVSPHTNFEMASQSLSAAVRALEQILGRVAMPSGEGNARLTQVDDEAEEDQIA